MHLVDSSRCPWVSVVHPDVCRQEWPAGGASEEAPVVKMCERKVATGAD